MAINAAALAVVRQTFIILNNCMLWIGFFGNLVCFAVFFRARKLGTGFYIHACARFVEFVATCAFLIGQLESRFLLTSNRTATEDLYIEYNYAYVWFAAHVQGQIPTMLHTIMLFFTMIQCIDRVYAVVQPVRYFNTSEVVKEHRANIGMLLSTIFGVLLNLYDCFRLSVVESRYVPGMFTIDAPKSFFTDFINFLVGFRVTVRVMCALLLIVGNGIVLVYIERHASILQTNRVSSIHIRRTRSLCMMCIVQSIIQSAAHILAALHYIVSTIAPAIAVTGEFIVFTLTVVAPVGFASISLVGFLFMFISREFRLMISGDVKSLKNWWHKRAGHVKPLTGSSENRNRSLLEMNAMSRT